MTARRSSQMRSALRRPATAYRAPAISRCLAGWSAVSGATAARAGDVRFALLTAGSASACLTISQDAAEKARNITIGMYTHQLIIASSIQRRAGQRSLSV